MRRLLLFFIFVLGAFILLLNESSAQEISPENSSISQSPDLSEEKEATPPAFIEYNLAYPGILPDHPLYKLKVLRDKISVAFISNPRKKIDFYLLQADKGILAAAMLVDKNNILLAKETALKAEHNYTLLTYKLYLLGERGGLNETLFNRLRTASLKHQEVLASLIKRVKKDDRKEFQTVQEFSKRNWKSVEEYQNQPTDSSK